MQRGRAVKFDVALMERDIAERGWQATDVATRCDPRTATSSVTRFLKGEVQTARMAKRIAGAIGRSVKRYIVDPEEAIAS